MEAAFNYDVNNDAKKNTDLRKSWSRAIKDPQLDLLKVSQA